MNKIITKNMKKLLILTLLFALPIVYAEELFSGSVQDGEYFTAGNYNCTTKYSKGTGKIVFTLDDLRRILEVGECFTEGNVKACFDDVEEDDFGYATSITVSVYDLAPSITIERTFSDTTVNLWDTIEIETTIKNEGDKSAYNIVFTDSFPAQLKLIRGPTEGNSVKWTGKLNKGAEEKLKYRLQADGIIEYASKAKLSYTFSGRIHTKTSSEEVIKVVKPYKFTTKISSESPKKNEIIIFDLTIDNSNGKDKLEINNLVIEPSKHVKIINYPKTLEKEDNTLSYSGTVAKESTKVFSVYVKSSRVGEHSIKAIADLKLGTINFNEESIKEFGIGVSKISALINISPKIVKSGNDIKLKVFLKNTGDKEIKSINAKVESDLFDAIDALNKKVYQGKTKEIVTKTIIAPDVGEERTYKIKVTGSYKDNEQLFTFKEQGEVTVKPQPKVIELLYELNKEEFSLGDAVKVDVFVVNLKNIELTKVSLIEILPNEVKYSLKGTITDDINVGANQKKKAYSYSFVIPEDYGKDTLKLRTIANTNFEGSLHKYEITKQLTIGEIEDKETIDKGTKEIKDEPSLKENQELEEGIQEKEKINFFKRVINFFKNLFTRSQPAGQE